MKVNYLFYYVIELHLVNYNARFVVSCIFTCVNLIHRLCKRDIVTVYRIHNEVCLLTAHYVLSSCFMYNEIYPLSICMSISAIHSSHVETC